MKQVPFGKLAFEVGNRALFGSGTIRTKACRRWFFDGRWYIPLSGNFKTWFFTEVVYRIKKGV